MKKTKLLFSALVSAATLSCAPALFSANLTWNGSDGDSWNTSTSNTNWLDSNNNSTFFSWDDNVTFGPNDANETVVVFAVSAGNITVSGAYTYTGVAVYADSLTVSAGGALTIDALVAVRSIDQKGFVVAGKISGAGTLSLAMTDDADNTIHLGAGNDFKGTVEVVRGSFSLSDSDIGNGTYGIYGDATTLSSKDTTVSNNINFGSASSMQAFDVVSETTLTLSGKLYGVGGMDKQGAGTLVLCGENTYKGGTTISAGTVVAANASALGTGAVSVASGAKLEQSASSLTLGGLSGAGTVEYTGTDAGTLTVNSAADTNETFSGAIVGENLSLVKTGTGTLTLSGESNTLAGVEVAAGTLVAASDSALGTGTVSISGGQLSVADGVELNKTTIAIVLSEENLTTAAIDGSGSLAAETTITLSLDETIANAIAASETGLSFQILGETLAKNSSGIDADNFSVGGTSSGDLYELSYEAGVLTIAALPEPSAFGLLAGLGALALVAARRRRGRKAA